MVWSELSLASALLLIIIDILLPSIDALALQILVSDTHQITAEQDTKLVLGT
jgi:hypothetical protein